MDDLLKKEIPWLDKANYFMCLKKEASMRQNVGALMGSTLMGGLAYTRYKPDPKTGLSRAEKDALGQLKAHTAGIDSTTSNTSGLDRLKGKWIEAKLKGAKRAGHNPAKAGLFWAVAGAPVGAALARRMPFPAMRAASLLKTGNQKLLEKNSNPQVRGRMLSALRRLHPGAKKPRPTRGPGPSVMGEPASPVAVRGDVAMPAGRDPAFGMNLKAATLVRPENLRAPAKGVEPPTKTGPTVVPAPPMAPPEEASLTTIPYRVLRSMAPYAAVGAGGAMAHRAFSGPRPPTQPEYTNA